MSLLRKKTDWKISNEETENEKKTVFTVLSSIMQTAEDLFRQEDAEP